MTLLNTSLIPLDLDELYAFANQRYFNNELPRCVDFEWSSRMLRKLGTARPRTGFFDDNHLITISDKLRNSSIKLLNVMVHEMLHIKQFHLSEVESSSKYLDNPKNLPRFVRNEYRQKSDYNRGHGHYFHTWKDELNKRFTELAISAKDDDMPDDYDMSDKVFYGVCIEFKHMGKQLYTMYHSEINFMEGDNSGLVEDIIGLYGRDNIIGVKFLETSNANIQMTNKLLNSGGIRKRSAKSYYDNKFVKELLLDSRTEVRSDFAVKPDESLAHIDKDIREVVGALGKANGMSFKGFLLTVAKNYANTTNNLKYHSSPFESLSSGYDKVFTDDVISYTYDSWSSATPLSFFESQGGRSLVRSVYSSVMKKDSKEFLSSYLEGYSKDCGLYRFDPSEFLSVLVRKVSNFAGRKNYGPSKSEIKEYFSDFPMIRLSKAQIEDVYAESSRHLDKSFENYWLKTVSLAVSHGHMDFKKSQLDDAYERYNNPSPSDVRNTGTQIIFNKNADEYFTKDSDFTLEAMLSLADCWTSRMQLESVLKGLISGYKHHLTDNGKNNLESVLQRVGELKERLLSCDNSLFRTF